MPKDTPNTLLEELFGTSPDSDAEVDAGTLLKLVVIGLLGYGGYRLVKRATK